MQIVKVINGIVYGQGKIYLTNIQKCDMKIKIESCQKQPILI